MAEYVANAVQTVESNQNILFTSNAVCGNNSIVHRDGSGLVTLRGLTNQYRALFKVTFGANAAISTGGTVGPISLAIAINGEPIGSSTMTLTPAGVGAFNNVSSSIIIGVPKGCCQTVSVRNISTQAVDVINSNIIIERLA